MSNRPLQWKFWQSDAATCRRARDVYDDTPLKGLPAGASATLAQITAVVVGLGAVGGAVFEQLARAGVGTLFGVDPDSYGRESPLTQPVAWERVGQAKALVQGALAHAANPAARVMTAVGQAQDLPLAVLRRADAIVAAGDNLELVLWAGRMAAALGKRLVQGAVHGESMTAIVRGYDLRDADAACPGCGLGHAEYAALRSRQGCDPGTLRDLGREPTRTSPVVCALAAQLAASEAIKHLTGLDRGALSGEECAYSLLSHRALRTTLPRTAGCRQPHERWELVDVPHGAAETSIGRLASEIGIGEYSPLLQVRGETPWFGFALCAACGRRQGVRRFARLGENLGRCACGGELPAGPLGMRSVMPAADLRAAWEQPLDDLGLADGDALGISPAETWTWFVVRSGAQVESLNSVGNVFPVRGAATP